MEVLGMELKLMSFVLNGFHENPYMGRHMDKDFTGFKVADLMDRQSGGWRMPLVDMFPEELATRISALYVAREDCKDALLWEPAKDGNFSVKTAYYLQFRGDLKEWWMPIMLSMDYGVRYWRVREALLSRLLDVNPLCLVCNIFPESMEHLFLVCELAKRLWCASHLGFDFDVGSPMRMEECFADWIKKAPDRDVIWDSVCILWVIWCARNDVVLQNVWCSVDEALSRFLVLKGTLKKCEFAKVQDNGSQMENGGLAKLHGNEVPCFEFRRDDFDGRLTSCFLFATDGAWLAGSLRGAFAWVVLDQNGNLLQSQAVRTFAQSAAMVEVLAGVKAMEWAAAQRASEP